MRLQVRSNENRDRARATLNLRICVPVHNSQFFWGVTRANLVFGARHCLVENERSNFEKVEEK